MSVSDTGHLSALDAVLYDRPAGRNIIDFARETIERLREQLLICENKRLGGEQTEIERLRKLVDDLMRLPAQKEIERLNALILTVSNNIASSPAKVLEESALVGKALDRLAQQDQEIEKLRAVQEAQQRELVLRAHNQTRHLEEVQKLRGEIDALQRLVQREQAEVYRLSTVFVKPGEHE